MIKKIKINNFKSVQNNSFSLGRFNVFIGENGCGKSNILEAMCFASSANSKFIDNIILASKGVRVVPEKMTRSAFEVEPKKWFYVEIEDNENRVVEFKFENSEKPFSPWEVSTKTKDFNESSYPAEFVTDFKEYLFKYVPIKRKEYFLGTSAVMSFNEERFANLRELLQPVIKSKNRWLEKDKVRLTNQILKAIHDDNSSFYFEELKGFYIYSPENSYLRVFEDNETNNALGIKGQGIFSLIQSFAKDEDKSRFNEIKKLMKLIDWIDDIKVPEELFATEARLNIKDRFLAKGLNYFDQRSSNEGFLFLLFYFSLFISKNTPAFFAIDNIDASLNPKLCSKLIQELVKLAKKYDKQVILTTHNPAILDGLSLSDDEQRLFAVYRNRVGHTKTRRIHKPIPADNQPQPLLSDLFISGSIGGLPNNF